MASLLVRAIAVDGKVCRTGHRRQDIQYPRLLGLLSSDSKRRGRHGVAAAPQRWTSRSEAVGAATAARRSSRSPMHFDESDATFFTSIGFREKRSALRREI